MTTREMKIFAAEIRKTVLYGLDTVKSGHTGGCMSMADLLAVLYGEVMNVDPKNPQLKTRDRLVVSKGHCGPAVYAALALKGYFPMEWMKTINLSQTKLPSHCDMNMVPGIDMTTGSLGQGMSTALGLAWGLRYQKINSYVYLVLGDGECDEGQVWEGALFAGTKKLNNIIAFVDQNLKQLDGYTKDICDVGDLRKKFEDFGWFAQEVNGNDVEEIKNAIEVAKLQVEKPSMIVLHTEKGKDCTFAQDVFYNHHMTFTEEQYEEAVHHLDEIIKEA